MLGCETNFYKVYVLELLVYKTDRPRSRIYKDLIFINAR